MFLQTRAAYPADALDAGTGNFRLVQYGFVPPNSKDAARKRTATASDTPFSSPVERTGPDEDASNRTRIDDVYHAAGEASREVSPALSAAERWLSQAADKHQSAVNANTADEAERRERLQDFGDALAKAQRGANDAADKVRSARDANATLRQLLNSAETRLEETLSAEQETLNENEREQQTAKGIDKQHFLKLKHSDLLDSFNVNNTKEADLKQQLRTINDFGREDQQVSAIQRKIRELGQTDPVEGNFAQTDPRTPTGNAAQFPVSQRRLESPAGADNTSQPGIMPATDNPPTVEIPPPRASTRPRGVEPDSVRTDSPRQPAGGVTTPRDVRPASLPDDIATASSTPVSPPGHSSRLAVIGLFLLAAIGSGVCLGYFLYQRFKSLLHERNLHRMMAHELKLLRLTADVSGSRVKAETGDGDWSALDLDADTLAKRHLADLIVPEDRTKFLALLEEARQPDAKNKTRKFAVKCRLAGKDGRAIPAVGVLALQRSMKGTGRYTVLLQDSIHREASRDAGLQLQKLVSSLPQGVLVEDRRRRTSTVNAAFYKMLGLNLATDAPPTATLAELANRATGLPEEIRSIFVNGGESNANGAHTVGNINLHSECSLVQAEGQVVGRVVILTPEIPGALPVGDSSERAASPKPAAWEAKQAEAPWCPVPLRSHIPWLSKYTYLDQHAERFDGPAGWQIVAATRRGRVHAQRGAHREDAFGAFVSPLGCAGVCVSDGAGSSKYSRIGSEAVCRGVLERLEGSLPILLPALATAEPVETVKLIAGAMGTAVLDTCQQIREIAALGQAEAKDFRATLLLVVLIQGRSGNYLLGSQVGDGTIVALLRDGTTRRFGEADSGRFAGEVSCFLPDPDGVKKAHRIFRIPLDEVATLLLFSDGVDDPFNPLDEKAKALFHQLRHGVGPSDTLPGFEVQEPHGPVLGNPPDPAALERWLAFEKRGENDDRTILILTRPVDVTP